MTRSGKLILFIVIATSLAIAAGIVFTRQQTAPEVQFATLAGKKFNTSDLRGKVVLVNFWATSCVSCVREMPTLVDTYRKYAPRGYDMVAVAMSYDHPNFVAEFAQKHALPFTVALDLDGNVAKQWGNVRVTPTTYLVDRRGRILKHYLGEPPLADLHALIEKALADPV